MLITQGSTNFVGVRVKYVVMIDVIKTNVGGHITGTIMFTSTGGLETQNRQLNIAVDAISIKIQVSNVIPSLIVTIIMIVFVTIGQNLDFSALHLVNVKLISAWVVLSMTIVTVIGAIKCKVVGISIIILRNGSV